MFTIGVFPDTAAGVNLDGLTITHGDASNGGADFGDGSGIDDENAVVTLTDVTVSGNSIESGGQGAGILNDGGTMTIVDSTISGTRPAARRRLVSTTLHPAQGPASPMMAPC